MDLQTLLSSDPIIQEVSKYFGIPLIGAFILIILFSVWSLIWMGYAMWKAAKKDHKTWFLIFLLIHTAGILEILYIYVFSNMDFKKFSYSEKKLKKKK